MKHVGTALWAAILAIAIFSIAGGYLSGEALKPRPIPVGVALPEIAPIPIRRTLFGARGFDVPLEPEDPGPDEAIASRPPGWAPGRSPQQREVVRLAIVICGLGEDRTLDRRFAAIPYPLTFAVPAEDQPADPLRTDPNALVVDASGAAPTTVASSLAALHAGGVLTSVSQPPQKPATLVAAVSGSGGFIIDGMAGGAPAIYDAARARRVAAASRDVVIDAREEEPYIRFMIRQAARLARRTGVAIAVGHAYPETYEALRRTLPNLGADDVQIVPVGELVARPSPT
ncbi:MAG: divergent polysaccharide deacetylase family protein [Candidatus Eremiobacteraeota bacterium]|nr:divergent polysaccharide deacetylase family protein [Candidatus Eremiobacteraeota bacterium]